MTTPVPPSPAGLRPTTDGALPALLRRLLLPAAPELGDRLRRRSAAESDAALLARIGAWRGVHRSRVADADGLAALTSRALCVSDTGIRALLERDGAAWTVDLDGSGRARAATVPLLTRLFPCDAWFVAAPDRSAAPGRGPGSPEQTALPMALLKLVAQLLGLALPVAMMLIIDRVVTQGAANTLTALVLGVTLLTLGQYLLLWLHLVACGRRAELLGHPARAALFADLLGSREGARWSTRGWDVLQSTAEAARFAAETRPQRLADAAFVALLGALMAAFSPRLLLVSLAFVPLYVLLEAWGGRDAEAAGAGITARRAEQSRRFLEALAASDLVRGLALGPHLSARWEDADADLAVARCRLTLRRRQAALGIEFLQKLSVILIMLLGVGAVIEGAMTLGQYIAFNLLSLQLGAPVLRLAGHRRAAQDHRVGRAARRQLEQRCRATAWGPDGARTLPRRERIGLQVDGVAVGAESGRRTVSFGLIGGRWLGITGPSGAGKSSLLKVLAGIDPAPAGRVCLNGVDVRALSHRSLAARVRLVPQDAVVFSLSLAENIQLGDPAATPARILAAAATCGVLDFAERLPDHLNTLVGPGGRALSGGERQRLALARAILPEPELLLLDEATAALDEPAEARLLDALRRCLPRAAVVVVAHRPSSLRGCADLLRLDPSG